MERVFFVKKGENFQRAPTPWSHAAALSHPDVLAAPEKERSKIARRVGTKIVYDMLGSAIRAMERLSVETGKLPPLSADEFVETFVGSKRKLYASVVESFGLKPFDLVKDSVVKCFTKDEYSKGVPRIIQPRTPRFNVMLGRWIKHLEHVIYHDLDRLFDPSGEHVTVQKGRTHIERGNAIHKAWSEFNRPVCILLDAARFDQSLNILLLMIANKLTRMYSTEVGPEELYPLAMLLKAQLFNRGRFYGEEGTIKYSVEGCGMSGDMNTSLRNVIIMCLSTYAFMSDMNVPYRYGNDGDDGWLITEAKYAERICDAVGPWFLKLGLTMKVEGIAYNLEDVEFCQGRPVFNEDHGYVLIPSPRKRLYSDLVSTKDLASRKVYNKWVGAVAGCGLAQSVGVPVLQNHYRWLAKAATPWIPELGDYYYRHSWWNASNLPTKKTVYRQPSHRERISFYLAFDITPEAQRQMELYYDQLEPARWMSPADNVRNEVPPMFRAFAPPIQKDRTHVHIR